MNDLFYRQYEKLAQELRDIAEQIRPELCTTPSQVLDYCKAKLAGLKKEVGLILFLNAQNKIIGTDTSLQGTIDQVVIYPREIIIKCLESHATAIIFCHNHPSGETSPSGADIRLTQSLSKACEALDINLLDHIIVDNNCDDYFSFKEEGIL